MLSLTYENDIFKLSMQPISNVGVECKWDDCRNQNNNNFKNIKTKKCVFCILFKLKVFIYKLIKIKSFLKLIYNFDYEID